MEGPTFPTASFCSSIVRFLDALEYDDHNLTHTERIAALREVHEKTVEYFHQPLACRSLKQVDANRIAAVTRTIPPLVVYCWSRVPRNVQVDISIYLALMNVLDDHEISHDSSSHLASFWTDLLQGKEQKHPLWLLTNTHLPNLLRHYGTFCSWNIMRSTFDFFEGCWIEQHDFQGYAGADCFPAFMRRLNGLGGAVGGTLFPRAEFDDQESFNALSCAMAHMDGPVTLINDLFSYYKEFNLDEANLVSNWCTTDGINKEQALERLTDQTVHACKRILEIFQDKDPKILETIRCFIHGYITFHICSKRYRLSELYENPAGTDAAAFRQYYEQSLRAGKVDPNEWTLPSDRLQFGESALRDTSLKSAQISKFPLSFISQHIFTPIMSHLWWEGLFGRAWAPKTHQQG